MPDDLSKDNSMLESAAIEPLEREQRLYERVVEKVLELISSGAWKPGYRLPPER
jgi:DNA-binding GntR family transcriptional regulator